MNKRLTAVAAALAVLTTPAFGASALELYGKVNVTVQNTDIDSAGGDKWELKSNASRFGIKGELGIDEGFAGFYQLEWEVDPADNANGSTDNIKSRNQYVGLKGSAGQILVGRSDTPMKLAQNKIDLFNDLDGDLKAIFNGEIRANNIVHYTTPSFGGFKVNVASLFQEKVDTPAATDNDQDGFLDATSISLEWSNKDFYVALALDDNIGYTRANKRQGYLDGAQTTRAVVQYKIGDFQLGGMWQNHDNSQSGAAKIDEDGMLVSLAYNINSNLALKVQHGTADIIAKGGEQTSFGVDYKLAKNVMVFGFYTEETADGTNADKAYLGGGLEVKF